MERLLFGSELRELHSPKKSVCSSKMFRHSDKTASGAYQAGLPSQKKINAGPESTVDTSTHCFI